MYLRTTKLKILLALLERILLGEILGALRVLAVKGWYRIHRQDAKEIHALHRTTQPKILHCLSKILSPP